MPESLQLLIIVIQEEAVPTLVAASAATLAALAGWAVMKLFPPIRGPHE